MPERTCQRPGCGRTIPSRKRTDARWCSRSCESKARRAAARKARFEAANPGSAELLGAENQSLTELHDRAGRPDHWDDPETEFSDEFDLLHEAPDDETGIVAGDSAPVRHEADIRFAAMIEDDIRFAAMIEDDQRASGGPSQSTRKVWRQYGKRHGTEHPGQTADRLARHQAAEAARTARIDSMTDSRVQDRFDDRTRPNVGRNGADSRRLNRRFLPDDDMPRSSPGFDFTNETVNGGPFARGRPTGQRSRHADYRWAGLDDGFRY